MFSLNIKLSKQDMQSLKIFRRKTIVHNFHKHICSSKQIKISNGGIRTISTLKLHAIEKYNHDFFTYNCNKNYCTVTDSLDPITFEKICEETLESLSEYFEELIENSSHLNSADVSYAVSQVFLMFLLLTMFKNILERCFNNKFWSTLWNLCN